MAYLDEFDGKRWYDDPVSFIGSRQQSDRVNCIAVVCVERREY